MGFTKLWSEIIASSIWCEDDRTRLVWITMLAMCDRKGNVLASVKGLANQSRVSPAACEAALKVFLNPDPDSRSKEHQGRRIEEIDGGWRLLNYAKFREKGRAQDRREYFAEYKRQRRKKAPPFLGDVPPDQQSEERMQADLDRAAKWGNGHD